MDDMVKNMAGVFKALGDTKRLRIIRMLASGMENELCVADLAEKLGITQPAASQHIRVLKNVGILEPNRQGYRVYYVINTDVLRDYKDNLDALFKMAFEKCPNQEDCRGHEG